jgi:hypothetical protein
VSRRSRSFGERQLHLLADAEKIWKRLLVQEAFLPIQNVNVHVRFPPEAFRKICAAAMEWRRGLGTMRRGSVEEKVPEALICAGILWALVSPIRPRLSWGTFGATS